MKPNQLPFLVAIVGGSGSGKTWLVEKLQAVLADRAVRISLDDFYIDRSHVPVAERGGLNFDHPEAIDWPRVEATMEQLRAGQTVQLPCYDFKTHCREKRVQSLAPKPIVLFEGLWLLHRPSLRSLFNLKLFIECPTQTRLRRRVERDSISRGRTQASVRKQFEDTVEPMHRQFVSPQKRWADVVLPYDFSQHEITELAKKLAIHLPAALELH
jgi:uridine kinase